MATTTKEIDFTPLNHVVNLKKAVDLLDLPANDSIRLVNPYEEIDEINIPEVSYFGGDGKILHMEIEQNKVKKTISNCIYKVTYISKKSKRKTERCLF
eukprot:snap_masked-scaffold_97-processed-gene-0.15-mRNA-1 protein AED:1.00 eAED:1.00 QI:0/-1/0/0/-1/1/1/0/97